MPDHPMPDELALARFRRSGFVVLPNAFDPQPLSDEIDDALANGVRGAAPANMGGGGVGFRCVPMMCERTPVSLELIDALAPQAAWLLGRPVLPVRAKGTCYLGPSELHRDSELPIPSIGFVAYLEPLDGDNGALRVVPGSHRDEHPSREADTPTGDPADRADAVPTEPGDVIAFDEHLTHGSIGGEVRRQWRVDFVPDPAGDDELEIVRTYFARMYEPTWDGGYDVEAYPSYGPHWQAARRPWTERLRELGVYERAAIQEAAVRNASR